MTPRGVANLDPRGMVGRFYERGLLNIDTHKILKLYASWFQRSRFSCFFLLYMYVSLCELMTLGCS